MNEIQKFPLESLVFFLPLFVRFLKDVFSLLFSYIVFSLFFFSSTVFMSFFIICCHFPFFFFSPCYVFSPSIFSSIGFLSLYLSSAVISLLSSYTVFFSLSFLSSKNNCPFSLFFPSLSFSSSSFPSSIHYTFFNSLSNLLKATSTTSHFHRRRTRARTCARKGPRNRHHCASFLLYIAI